MALPVQPIALQFAGGIETRQDAKQVPTAKLLDLQNGVFTGVSTISKRNGYRALGKQIVAAGAEYSAAKALAVRGDELLALTQYRAYSYRESANHWIDTGPVSGLVATERTIAKTGTEQSQCDAVTASGVTVVAWVDSRGGVWSQTLDATSYAVIRRAAQISSTSTANKPRCVAVGTQVHVYYADAAAKRIYVCKVDPLNPAAISAESIVIDDLSPTSPYYDACTSSLTATPALIAWVTDAGNAKAAYVVADGRLGSPVDGLPSATVAAALAVGPISCCNAGAASAVAVSDGANGGLYLVTSSTLAAATSIAFSIPSITGVATVSDGTKIWAIWESSDGAASERDYRVHLSYYDGSNFVLGSTQRGVCLASQGWAVDGKAYVYLAHDVPYFSVYLAWRLEDGAFIARTMPIVAHGRTGWLSSATVAGNTAKIPLLYNEQLETEAAQFAETGIRMVALDYAHADQMQTATLGAGLYLSGASPQHYDGNRWAEAGWHTAPDGTIGAVASPGGSLSDGLYTYKIWYEEVDAVGEIHRGPVSVGTTVSVSAGNKVTLTGPMLRTTDRDAVRVCIARSEANDSSAFYRVTSLDQSTIGASNGFLQNSVTSDTWSFVDELSDSALIAKEPLYTNGGVLSNDPAPMAGSVLSGGKNRLWWVDSADRNIVRYTQALQDGFAVDWPASLSIKVDPFGGAIVGIATMDDTVIVFKESAIYAIGGPGPLAAPQLSPEYAFTEPALVTSDVGCRGARSIVAIPDGIMFDTSKGIYSLGRDRQVRFTGSSAHGYKSQIVSRATLLADQSRVHFLTANGRALSYDYNNAQWSTFTNHEGKDSVIWRGSYCYLRNDDRVFVETPGLHADDNTQIRLTIETAWIRMLGYLQGWVITHYAHFLGKYKSPHVLRVRYALDYEEDYSAPFDLDVNSNYAPSIYGDGAYGSGDYGGRPSTVYQRRIHLGKHNQAIKLKIEDVEATNDFGASFELSELLLTGGVMTNPAFKLPATRSD